MVNIRRRRANLFANDLKSLLYAYGDVANPSPDTIAVLEDILQEYIGAVCLEAHRVAKAANRQKLKVEDFKFALRNDPRKLGRVEELLSLQKEITEARKTFDNSEGKMTKAFEDEAKDKDKDDKDKDKEKDKDKGKEKDKGEGKEKKKEKSKPKKKEKEKEKDNKDKEKEKDKN